MARKKKSDTTEPQALAAEEAQDTTLIDGAVEAELAADGAESPPEETAKDRKAMRKASREAVRDPKAWRDALRFKVKMAYDLQVLRIQAGGRGTKKAENGEVQLHEMDIAVLNARSKDLQRAEKYAFDDVKDHLATSRLYREVLSDKKRFKGLGPAMAAVILSEYDITRLDTPSKMWAFAGLAPVNTRRCKTCQGIVKPNGGGTDGTAAALFAHEWKTKAKCEAGDPIPLAGTFDSGKAMRPQKGEKLPYNAWLKTKLVGVLGSCLLKANSPWRKSYDDYKHRKQSAGWGMSDGHRHNAAVRFMVKHLLAEIWGEWRRLEGLEVRPSYQEQYLGHVHGEGSVGLQQERMLRAV